MFETQKIKAAAHGAKRLGKIVDDAMQQNFFLLNFAEKLFVDQKGIARGLEPLLLLREVGGQVSQDQDFLAIKRECEGFERNVASIFISFGPIARTCGAFRFGVPEFFGVHQEVFEERRVFGETISLSGFRLYRENVAAPGRTIS